MESTSRPSGRTSPGSMSQAAFSRRVDELLLVPGTTLAEAIGRAAQEEVHGRTDAPLVVAGAVA